jgi:hypothetical protein
MVGFISLRARICGRETMLTAREFFMVATAPLRASASISGKESMSATTLSSVLDCEKARSTNNRRSLERPGKTSGTPESNARSQVLASGSPLKNER